MSPWHRGEKMANWAQFGLFHLGASGLDNNGCVLSYFEGTDNLHCYTSCTLTTLHCRKVSFLKCCHMKRYNKIFTKMWWVYSLLRYCIPVWGVNPVLQFCGHSHKYQLLVKFHIISYLHAMQGFTNFSVIWSFFSYLLEVPLGFSKYFNN